MKFDSEDLLRKCAESITGFFASLLPGSFCLSIWLKKNNGESQIFKTVQIIEYTSLNHSQKFTSSLYNRCKIIQIESLRTKQLTSRVVTHNYFKLNYTFSLIFHSNLLVCFDFVLNFDSMFGGFFNIIFLVKAFV